MICMLLFLSKRSKRRLHPFDQLFHNPFVGLSAVDELNLRVHTDMLACQDPKAISLLLDKMLDLELFHVVVEVLQELFGLRLG